jgi:hypothetical protein
MADDSSKYSYGKKSLQLVKKIPDRKAKIRIHIEIMGDRLLLKKQLEKMDVDLVRQEFVSEMREIGDIDLCRFEVELD